MFELFNKYDKTSLGTVETISEQEIIEHFNSQFENTEEFDVAFINKNGGSVTSENGSIDFIIVTV